MKNNKCNKPTSDDVCHIISPGSSFVDSRTKVSGSMQVVQLLDAPNLPPLEEKTEIPRSPPLPCIPGKTAFAVRGEKRKMIDLAKDTRDIVSSCSEKSVSNSYKRASLVEFLTSPAELLEENDENVQSSTYENRCHTPDVSSNASHEQVEENEDFASGQKFLRQISSSSQKKRLRKKRLECAGPKSPEELTSTLTKVITQLFIGVRQEKTGLLNF